MRAGRDFESDGDTGHHLDAAPRQESGEQQLVDPFRHRRRRAVREHRLRTEGDGDLKTAAKTLRDAVMLRPALVALPVHRGRAAVEHLHPVRPDVAHSGFGILGEYQWKRNELAGVLRPAFQDRQRIECAVTLHDLMAGRVPYRFRHQVAQAPHHRQQFQRVHDALRHLRRHELVDLPGQIVEPVHAERETHPLDRSVQVGRDRDVESRRLLEQQRRPAARHLARAIRHRRDLEVGADRLGDAGEQAAAIEIGDEVVEVGVHGER